jgi:gamma-glutamylcyclotransferase (GGCT)/AIG2-like uncharacterized protein YtfP
MAERLFVYGTLKDPLMQQSVFGRVEEGKPDTLIGYAISQIVLGGDTYPIIRPDFQSRVEGLLIDVSDYEFALIDRYEGDDYARTQVTLESGVRAWVYCAPGG